MAVNNTTQKKQIELIDALILKADQLQAALAVTWGDGSIDFEAMSENIKDNYFYLCDNLSRDIRALAEEIGGLALSIPPQPDVQKS